MGYPSTDPGYDEEDIGESHKILKNQSSLKPPVQKETVIEKVKEGSLKPRMDFESVIPACRETAMISQRVLRAQHQNLELTHHKWQPIEGHHLFHSAQLLLHRI